MKNFGYLSNQKIIDIFRKKRVAICLIVLISAIIYYNSLKAPFVYDDIPHIVENPEIRQIENIISGIESFMGGKRLFTLFTFYINYKIGSLSTVSYHVFNLFLHLFNVLIAFILFNKVTKCILNEDSLIIPFLTCLIFAVHPVNTEVVTYVYNRACSLASLFYMISLLFFIKFIEERRVVYYLVSIVSFVVCFYSKETAITFPIMILVWDLFLQKKSVLENLKNRWVYHVIYWLILVILLVLRSIRTFEETTSTEFSPLFSGILYYINQPWIILKYLQLIVFPVGLSVDHSMIKPIISLFETRFFISLILIFVLVGIIWRLFRLKTEFSKLILFGIFWFFLTLSPTNIFWVHIGERHLYLSGIGLYLIISILVLQFLKLEVLASIKMKYIKWFVVFIFIIILSIITIKRNKLYKDPIFLWNDVILKYPDNYKAYDNRGGLYEKRGEFDKAFSDYCTAVAINPEFANAYDGLGVICYLSRQYVRAIEEYSKAICIYEKSKIGGKNINPRTYAYTHYNRGIAYTAIGKFREAIEDYTKAVKIYPRLLEAYNNRANTYLKLGEYERAIYDCNHILSIDPSYGNAYYNRAVAFFWKKDYENTWKDVRKMQELNYSFNPKLLEMLSRLSPK